MKVVMSRAGSKCIFLLALLAALWTVPYFFPVNATISLSYVVGYNNRVAVLVFALGAILFAFLTHGELASASSTHNQKVTRADLVASLAVVGLACFLRHHHGQIPGDESSYVINRLQMLASGLRPYKDVEFIYGPLHLWIPRLVTRVFGFSVTTGYYVWWYTQWLVGTAMLWTTVSLLPYVLRRRRLIFWFVLAELLFSISSEGTAYTPVRLAGAAFCVVVLCEIWRRTASAWLLLASGAAAILLGIGISPEQGLAVALGLIAWLALRAWTERTPQAIALAAGMAVITALCVLPFLWLGVFRVLAEFAGGAYQFPLVPSPATPPLLLAYIAAACGGVLALRHRQMEGPVIPLVLSGFATLPAVLGRADLGHLMLGSGAFLLGVAYLETRPVLGRWWSPLVICFLIVAPLLRIARSALRPDLHQAPPAFWYVGMTNGARASGEPGTSDVLHAPCKVIFRAPTVRPRFDLTPAAQCLDTGYFAGLQNVLTADTIARKAEELSREPLQPLLLRDLPLSEEFATSENHVPPLRLVQDGFFLPPVRNAPVNYDPIIRVIENRFTPGAVLPGGLRIWEPKTQSVSPDATR